MVHYSTEPEHRKFVKDNRFLSFAKNMNKKYW